MKKIIILLLLTSRIATAGITTDQNSSLSAKDLGLTKYSFSSDAPSEVLILEFEKTIAGKVEKSTEWLQASEGSNSVSVIYGAPIWGGGTIILGPNVVEKWEDGIIYGVQRYDPGEWLFFIRRRNGSEEHIRIRIRSESYKAAKDRRPDLPLFPTLSGESWGRTYENKTEANKPLETTTMAVTPTASQPSRQP